jgi:hypothetical protein
MMRGEYYSPFLMRRLHGWGPKGRICEDCLSYLEDDAELEPLCIHEKAPHEFFVVSPMFKACGLFKSQWQYEREVLEASGQQRLPFERRVENESADCGQ